MTTPNDAPAEVLRACLAEEIAAWQAEDRVTEVPPPGTEARVRLDTWFRARHERIAALSRDLERVSRPPAIPPPPEEGGSPCELARLTRRWISLWCPPVDWALFDALHAEAFEDRSASGRSPTKAGFAAGLRAFAEAFPDLRTSVDELLVDGNKVAVRWTATGTNRVAYLGVGPTHRTTRITGIEIVEFSAGAIVRRWGEWDISAHLRPPEI